MTMNLSKWPHFISNFVISLQVIPLRPEKQFTSINESFTENGTQQNKKVRDDSSQA